MTLDNSEITLSLHDGEGTTGPALLEIDQDFDSSFTPDHWIWLRFDLDQEPWIRVTYEEAQRMYDRLGLLLGKE